MKLKDQKIFGITVRDFELTGLKAVNTSFYDGNMQSIKGDWSHNHSHNSDSEDDYEKIKHWFHHFLSSPVTSWLIMSKDNKIYRVWAAIEIFCCLISSYYYAHLSIFYYQEVKENGSVHKPIIPVLVFEVIFGFHIIL